MNAAGSENDSPSRELARFAAETAQSYVPAIAVTLINRADRYLRGGDQESFTARGYPAIRYVEGREDFRHQHQDVGTRGGIAYGDLPQYLDLDYLAAVTKANVAALAALALGPDRPLSVRMLTTRLTNGTTLQWQPAPRRDTL